jgi:hypothetical protein
MRHGKSGHGRLNAGCCGECQVQENQQLTNERMSDAPLTRLKSKSRRLRVTSGPGPHFASKPPTWVTHGYPNSNLSSQACVNDWYALVDARWSRSAALSYHPPCDRGDRLQAGAGGKFLTHQCAITMPGTNQQAFHLLQARPQRSWGPEKPPSHAGSNSPSAKDRRT